MHVQRRRKFSVAGQTKLADVIGYTLSRWAHALINPAQAFLRPGFVCRVIDNAFSIFRSRTLVVVGFASMSAMSRK
jgi:hypothetical protein